MSRRGQGVQSFTSTLGADSSIFHLYSGLAGHKFHLYFGRTSSNVSPLRWALSLCGSVWHGYAHRKFHLYSGSSQAKWRARGGAGVGQGRAVEGVQGGGQGAGGGGRPSLAKFHLYSGLRPISSKSQAVPFTYTVSRRTKSEAVDCSLPISLSQWCVLSRFYSGPEAPGAPHSESALQ